VVHEPKHGADGSTLDFDNLPEAEVVRLRKLIDGWIDKVGVIGDEKYYLTLAQQCAGSPVNKAYFDTVLKDPSLSIETRKKMRETYSAEQKRINRAASNHGNKQKERQS
jgi:hypothetical protein